MIVRFVAFCNLLWLSLAGPGFVLCRSSLIDPMQHELQLVNAKTFTMKVKLARQMTSTAAFFYKASDSGVKALINDQLDVVAKDLKGIVSIVAIDCGDSSMESHCTSELGKGYTTPVLRIYPKLPMPAYNFQGKFVKNEIKKALLKHIPSHVEIVEKSKLPEFLSKFDTMPKVLLFSDKSQPSYIYKALSVAFHKKLFLGFVDVNVHPDLKKQYKVKSVPHLVLIKTNSKVETYDGEFEYLKMFEWLNVYAETFLLGGGYADDAKKSKPKAWKFDPLPRIDIESQMDVCFNKAHGFCVIYLTKGPISTEDKNMLIDLSENYKGQLNGKWMWMDLSIEKEFAKLFKSAKAFPSLVIFNPKKKLRYLLHDGDSAIDKAAIEKLMDKVLGGGARFTLLSGSLPAFAAVEAPEDEL